MSIFDKFVDRRNTNSIKWDENEVAHTSDDYLPLWVADMDFKVAPPILAAMQRRLDVGVFGYTYVPDTYYRAIIDWFERRHHWRVERDDIAYTIGVVPAISAIIKALAKPGSGVVVMTPVYNCFFSSIRNNGCRIVESRLICVDDGDSEEHYEIDFDSLEKACADPDTSLLLLCNPHNPAGRVWTDDELRRVDLIASRCGVTVVSDEIHCELTFPGHDYTPFATVATQPCMVCTSPSKAFNIAGLQNANIICTDHEMLARIDRAININEVCDVNPFGVDAVIAAYNEGEQWLDSLRDYLWQNYGVLRKWVADNLPNCRLTRLEGTYLAWLDYSGTEAWRERGLKSEQVCDMLLAKTHVHLNAGTMYGGEGSSGNHHIRFNLACPKSTLCEALERVAPALREILY